MQNKKSGTRVKMEEGELLTDCPECGEKTLSECIQTTAHDKKRKTEAVVLECDNRSCGEVFIATTKLVSLRKAKRKKNEQLNDWPDIKPKDLRF